MRARDRFKVRTDLDADALWERLLAHPRVRAAELPDPDPAPPEGRPFLIARQSPSEVRLRHWSGPADAPSPVIVMHLEQDEQGRTIVRGRFERRSRRGRLIDLPRLAPGGARWVVLSVISLVLAAALLAPVLIGAPLDTIVSVLVLLVLFTIPTALV